MEKRASRKCDLPVSSSVVVLPSMLTSNNIFPKGKKGVRKIGLVMTQRISKVYAISHRVFLVS
jgi:hypothetical protein